MPEQLELFPIDAPLVPIRADASISSNDQRTDRTGARKFAAETVARVLSEARGNICETARRLSCARDTIRKAIGEHDICRKARDDAQAIEAEHAAARRDAGEPGNLKLLPSSAKAARHGHGPALKELTDGGRIQFPELPAKTTFSGTRSDRTGARKFTPQEISNALIASQGNLSDAARQLGCARDTVYRAIKEHEVCEKALETALKVDVEIVTSHVWAAVKAGKPWAIKAVLNSAMGARHGWGPVPKK